MATQYSLITWAGLGTTVTFTDVGDIVNFTTHGAPNGHAFQFPDNGNTLPTGLSKDTTYYLRQGADANKFTIYPTRADALAGTNQITFTGTGSGTHKVIGAYWATLGATARGRYGTAGSERVYAGINAADTAIDAMTTDYSKDMVLEIYDAFDDTQAGGVGADFAYKWKSLTIRSKIGSTRSPAFHGGTFGGGYRLRTPSMVAQLIYRGVGFTVDGIELLTTAASPTIGAGVRAFALNCTVKNCLISGGYYGIWNTAVGAVLHHNVIHTCVRGIYHNATAAADSAQCYNNIVAKCTDGYTGSGGAGLSWTSTWNNIAVGCTNNWVNSPTNTFLGYNASEAGTPWGVSPITLAADFSDFVDYTNNNFRPASGAKPQVNSALAVEGAASTDVADDIAPNYESATFPNNLLDVGAYEYNHGEGLAPISVTFSDLQAGSTIRVFATGTQTVVASTTNSGTTYSPSGVGAATYDYTILKDGYIPIRITGVTFSDGLTIPGAQILDRAFSASSGLAYGTTATINTSTKRFALTTASTGQNWYSFWVEQYRSNSDLYNKEFPLQANGPASFTLKSDYEFVDSTSLAFLSRDGIRYLNSSGVQTASWAAILSSGVPSGARVRYQKTDGGTTNQAVITSGNMDELVQVYGDSTHGNFDTRGYLTLKVQEQGYDQIESNAVSLYGNLEDQLYVVGLAPTPNSVAVGNPSLVSAPTITDHAGSPVTWNSKAFSITITDSAAGNSGLNIMKWLRYSFEQGGTFQGKDAFNWHDLVQQNGSAFKTVRGKLYGDTGATLKGVRVVQNDGTTPHPDFTLFTADDGTTYEPPTSLVVSLSGFASGTRIQIYDTLNSVELFNEIVASTTKVYSETYSVDRAIRVRASLVDGVTAKNFGEANLGTLTNSAPTVSRDLEQTDDDTYNANAVDGSLVTGITFTDAATDIVNIDIDAGSTTWQSIYAAFAYWIFTEAGIADDIAYVEAIDTANYKLTSMKIKNTSSPTVPLEITGGYGVDSVTGASIDLVDTTGGTLVFAPDHVVAKIVTVGGANVITGDISDIAPNISAIKAKTDYIPSKTVASKSDINALL